MTERRRAILLASAALAAFAVLSYLCFPWHRSATAEVVPLPKTVTSSARHLAPVVVPARFPRDTVSLPGQSVTAPIDPARVGADDYLQIPGDVQRVGHYVGGGGLDGTVGDLLLTGHVNYAGQGTGAFGRIGRLHVGDAVITRGSGRTQAWRVTGLTSYLKSDGLPASIFRPGGPRVLTLVTCGGTLDTKAHSYLSNIVVTAKPAPVIAR
ncbi:class F sortase [Jatrophihabitans telluris]|uniref:Class F sortase n=1 Tax=Jatrophihabitans telluris TaxID=2038343 RepID=A0ABY4QY72_9ACTN|nr:class F sortase [Jatrophihabitans telluris]UQX88217.1 class F sortase [Jatrophihabitans telluris]